MPSLDLLRRHLFATAAVAGLILGGIIGLFFPIRAASPPKASKEAWVLPTIADTKRFHQDAYAGLRAARFWRTAAGPGQRSTLKLEWMLTAVITRPHPMAVVGHVGNERGSKPSDKPASNLIAIGAKLPDGSTLLRLTRDAIWFEKDGCLRERRLYRRVTTENNACLGGAQPDTTDPTKAAIPNAAAPAAASRRSGSKPAEPTPSARPAPKAATP